MGLAALVALVAWWPVLDLPLTGEDFVLLSRVRDGALSSPHVFRPLPDLWLAALWHLGAGASALPYHAASLALVAALAALAVPLAEHWLDDARAGIVVGIAFAGCAAGVDAIAWVAAVNRLLSCLGALLALLGLTRLLWPRASSRGALPLFFLGVAVQGASNSEAYGTALLGAVCFAWGALRGAPELRARAWIAAAAAAALPLFHYLVLAKVPEGTDSFLRTSPGPILEASWARLAFVGEGFGLAPVLLAAWLVVALACIGARWGTTRAALAAGALAASFVPFGLVDSVGYRSFPTLLPMALLLGGGGLAIVDRLLGHRWGAQPAAGSAPRSFVAATLVTGLAWIGASGPRSAELARWGHATGEARDVAAALAELDAATPIEALMNLDLTSTGIFHFFRKQPTTTVTRVLAFLDTPAGYVPPPAVPAGPLFGRRYDGSVGVVDPRTYFAGRAELPAIAVVREARRVGGLDEARALLAGSDTDVALTAVLDSQTSRALTAEVAAWLGPRGAFPAGGADAWVGAGSTTFDATTTTARLEVEVEGAAPSLLVIQQPWLYHHSLRFSADQALFSRVARRRVLVAEAWRLAPEGAEEPARELPVGFANAFGTGVLVPAGRSRVRIDWRRAAPGSLR
jgi:hypothetical protein